MEHYPLYLNSQRLNPKDQTIDQDLYCAICQELVQNSIECKECQTLFCKYCIQQWLEKRPDKTCPFKCGPQSFDKPHQKYFSALNKITFSCVNEDKGCKETVTFSSVEIHQTNECKYLQKIEKKEKFQQNIGYWFWKDDMGGFIAYKQEIQNILERSYVKNESLINFSIDQAQYQILDRISKYNKNQKAYFQKNLKTGYYRIVLRVTKLETYNNVLWCCQVDNEALKFSVHNCEILEKGFAEYIKDKIKNQTIQIEVEPFKYQIDFQHQTQENLNSHMKRNIYRLIIGQ